MKCIDDFKDQKISFKGNTIFGGASSCTEHAETNDGCGSDTESTTYNDEGKEISYCMTTQDCGSWGDCRE